MLRRHIPIVLAAAGALYPATAHAYPGHLFALVLGLAFHFGDASVEPSASVRMSWTDLETPLPMGADLELQIILGRNDLRIRPSAHASLRNLLGPECTSREPLRTRAEDMSLGPAFALMIGPLFETSQEGLRWGASAGGVFTYAFGAGHLRGAWIHDGGLEAELGIGVRIPSILGHDDGAVLCNFRP
ncbi:MAG: hypothetical protein IT384_03730 [Deltaproteobacteria bacterium]|nr:hypothetical protein [Deltaproteobacteria bacterium]